LLLSTSGVFSPEGGGEYLSGADSFRPDARDGHGNWLSRGDSVAGHIVGLLKPANARAMHFMSNILIEIEGNIAYSEAHVLAYRSFARDGRAYTRTRALPFVDRHARRDDVWRISERVVAMSGIASMPFSSTRTARIYSVFPPRTRPIRCVQSVGLYRSGAAALLRVKRRRSI
jgi:hypothetical protein